MVSERAKTERRVTSPALSKVWIVLGLLFAMYVLEQDVEAFLYSAGLQPGAGYLGATFASANGAAAGNLSVLSVVPDGAMARAGVAAGDGIRFDRAFEALREKRVGETVEFTLDHAGVRSRQRVVALPRPRSPEISSALILSLSNVIPALFGTFILWRSRGHRSVMLLGAALVAFGWQEARPQLWQSAPGVFPFFFALNLMDYVALLCFPAFAMCFVEDTLGPLRRWEWRAFWTMASVGILVIGLLGYAQFTGTRYPIVGDVTGTSIVYLMLALSVSLYYVVMGWRGSARETQKRYTLVLLAFAAVIAAQVIGVGLSWVYRTNDLAMHRLYWVAVVLSAVVAPGLLAYSIFRDKVFDLGFAVNRALVYGIISACMLVAFGLIEWASEHFLRSESIESSALLNAGLALTIFLVFHRVRDFVEGLVEKLLFHQWHHNEALLRRFVREASFVTSGETLRSRFLAELTRFSGGAECGFYVRSETWYHGIAGGLTGAATMVDADDPIVLRMRAEHLPVEVSDTASGLAAELALPMVQRSELNGFLLLGAKPMGESYRPDERELLGWAAHSIGLDLHALEVERLEARASRQEQELAVLRAWHDQQRMTLTAAGVRD